MQQYLRLFDNAVKAWQDKLAACADGHAPVEPRAGLKLSSARACTAEETVQTAGLRSCAYASYLPVPFIAQPQALHGRGGHPDCWSAVLIACKPPARAMPRASCGRPLLACVPCRTSAHSCTPAGGELRTGAAPQLVAYDAGGTGAAFALPRQCRARLLQKGSSEQT